MGQCPYFKRTHTHVLRSNGVQGQNSQIVWGKNTTILQSCCHLKKKKKFYEVSTELETSSPAPTKMTKRKDLDRLLAFCQLTSPAETSTFTAFSILTLLYTSHGRKRLSDNPWHSSSTTVMNLVPVVASFPSQAMQIQTQPLLRNFILDLALCSSVLFT